MKLKAIFALAAAGTVAASALNAQDGPSPQERAYALREAHMSLFAHNIGPLGGMAKGEVEYDPDIAARNARNIANLASVDMTSYWVEGSDSESLPDSRALPAAQSPTQPDAEGWMASNWRWYHHRKGFGRS